MQTEVMHYSIQNLKIPEIIIEFLRLELASDARWSVPLWGSSDFPSNESGWFQRRSSSYSASVKSFETSRQTWFFSFWDGILSIDSYHMRCEHEKTFTGMHVFLLVHFCYETTSVCIKLISVCVELTMWSKSTSNCVETTLYRNKCAPFKSIPDCIAHTMRCTLGSIQHGGWMTWKNVIASYIIVVLSKKLLYFLRIRTGKNL